MVTVELFQPGKVNMQLQLPSTWNELLLLELHLIAKSLLSPDETNLRAQLLDGFLKIRSKEQKTKLPKKLMGRINEEDAVINGFPMFDFIFDENTLTEQPYNRIKLNRLMGCTVYGPQSAFDNITCGEYEDAQIFYIQFKQDHNPEHLARLMSILWRPAFTLPLRGSRRGLRVPYMTLDKKTGKYKAYDSDKLMKRFLQLPAWQLYTAFTWYTGCLNHLTSVFYEIYDKAPSSSPPPAGGESEAADLLAFTKCIHAGAGPKNGTRDQIRVMLLKEFLMDVQLETIKAKELMKEYGKQ